MGIKEACVFDVDGVLIYADERIWRAKELANALNKNYRDFLYDEALIQFDKPRSIGIQLLKEKFKECPIVIITGRPKEFYDLTLNEITSLAGIRPELIIMREDRESNVVKAKLAMIEDLLKRRYEIKEIHDDDIIFLREVRKEHPQIKLFYHFHEKYVVLK